MMTIRMIVRRLGAARLNPLPLLVDQFKFLRDISTNTASVVTRIVVIGVAPITFAISVTAKWTLQSTSELTQALGLLAGVFISAFAIVFTLRLTLAARPASSLQIRSARLMDESALTLLAAGFLAGVDALWLTAVAATHAPVAPISTIPTAITIGLTSAVAVYFLLAVRRLHILYTDTFPPYWRAKQAAGEELTLEEAVAQSKRRR